jgi:signal transduction histidine kinase/ActR/RegA family two-component response regulator
MAGTPSPPSDELLFDQAACGLVVTGVDGTILRANARFCVWLGFDTAALAGRRRVQDFFTVGGRVFHQTHCAPMLHVQGSVAEVQVDLLHHDRSRLPMLMNIIRWRQGDAVLDAYAFFLATDRRSYERELLVARKAAEAELEARLGAEASLQELNQKLSLADRRKDEFLATLAHELRNPLAPMRNVVEAMKRHTLDARLQSWSLDVLDRQLTHITHLVDDLMEASRISQGRVTLRRKPLDLVAVLRAALDDVSGMIGAAGHALDVELPPQPMTVDADATRLAQVFINLLTNASKYTPRGGRIVVAAQRQGADAVVSVRDTGIGIPRESLATIFDMFSQLSPALERSQGGLGIGLALVRGLVALHGGTISADSEGVGKGSVFTVRLPVVATPASMPAIMPEHAAARGRRILVVDDNVDVAESMAMALGLFGHDTRAVHDGGAALRTGSEFLPDVVLLDIGLPGQNGYEVARQIRRAPWGRDLLLIAATGWGQDADRQLAEDAGFDHHLTKPVDFASLQTLLSERSR